MVASVYSWWRLVHRQAAAVVHLHEEGYSTHEVAPLMRNIFNHAVAVQWLIDNGDAAVVALARAGAQDRKSMLGWLKSTSWPAAVPYKEAIEAEAEANPEQRFDADAEARIRNLMDELDKVSIMFERYGQKGQYPVYKFLSWLSHTSQATANLYWGTDPETGELAIRATLDDPGQNDVIHAVLLLLLVDASFSPLLTGDPLREVIDRVLADMGWEGLALLPQRVERAPAGRQGGKSRRSQKK